MKLNCRILEERKSAKDLKIMIEAMEWHRHFCWLPVEISYGDCRWLEFVENRFRASGFYDTRKELIREFKQVRWHPLYNEWRALK